MFRTISICVRTISMLIQDDLHALKNPFPELFEKSSELFGRSSELFETSSELFEKCSQLYKKLLCFCICLLGVCHWFACCMVRTLYSDSFTGRFSYARTKKAIKHRAWTPLLCCSQNSPQITQTRKEVGDEVSSNLALVDRL